MGRNWGYWKLWCRNPCLLPHCVLSGTVCPSLIHVHLGCKHENVNLSMGYDIVEYFSFYFCGMVYCLYLERNRRTSKIQWQRRKKRQKCNVIYNFLIKIALSEGFCEKQSHFPASSFCTVWSNDLSTSSASCNYWLYYIKMDNMRAPERWSSNISWWCTTV